MSICSCPWTIPISKPGCWRRWRRCAATPNRFAAPSARTVVDNLKRMARMGVFLERNVHELYPEFPISSGLRSWEEYLPPLAPSLRRLVEAHESRPRAVGAN